MRRPAVILMTALLLGSSWSSEIQSHPASPPPDQPFDDVDPALVQRELTQQVAEFLETLRRHWGKDQLAVRRSVQGHLEREDGAALLFTRKVADHDVLEGYAFKTGALVGGQYLCLQRPVNGLNEFIDYYTAVKESLTASHGAPLYDRTIWANDLYQPLPDYWGVAVQIGHLRYAAEWDAGDGVLSLELTGNHHSRLIILYRSKLAVEPEHTAYVAPLARSTS